MRRLEGLALETLLNSTGEQLKTELPVPQGPLPTKLALLLERLETAEARGTAVLLDEKALRDRWLKVAHH
jgi:hypothetical protein